MSEVNLKNMNFLPGCGLCSVAYWENKDLLIVIVDTYEVIKNGGTVENTSEVV